MSRFLLDTQVLLWWAFAPTRLSEEARVAIGNGHTHVFVSAASAWEIAIKRRLGKLEVPGNISWLIQENRFIALPVSIEHAVATQQLSMHHRDPFDRLLIAQAQIEELRLITRDSEVKKYDVLTLAA